MRALPLIGAALATAVLTTGALAEPRGHVAASATTARVSAILYPSDWSGSFQIYAADPSRSGGTGQLTSGRALTCRRLPASAPCGYLGALPSPDGSRLLVWDGTVQGFERRLYVAGADGRGRRLLGRARHEDPAAAWAPDGRRFAYAGPDGIRVASASGSSNRLVPGTGSNDGSPTWSPDGRALAFVRSTAGTPRQELVVGRGTVRTVVARTEGTFVYSWSPAGTWIAYRADPSTIGLVRPDASARRRIRVGGLVSTFAWSPDGASLAFSDRDGVKLLDVANGSVRLLRPESTYELSWSGDGRMLAFPSPSSGDIHVVRVRTGALRVLRADYRGELAWAPDSRSVAFLESHPDGQADHALHDLRVASLAGGARTVVAANGRLGGAIRNLAWTRAPATFRYPRATGRTLATVGPDRLDARWPIDRIAADGGRIAYSACGHVFVWSPSTRSVAQVEATTSLSPACASPGYHTSYRHYSLAIAGDRVVHGSVYGGNVRVWWLGGLTGTRRTFVLGRGASTNGPAYGDVVGEPAGSGDHLAFSTWREVLGPEPGSDVTAAQEVRRAEPVGCPCPVLASSPGPLVPFDVDGGRVVAGGDNETWVLGPNGARLQTIPLAPVAAQLSGRDLVLVRRGELRHHDAASGAVLHTWALPDVPTGRECGSPNAGRCPQAQLVVQDAARGLVAYALDGEIRLLRLTDGATATVASGRLARFVDAGLVYAIGARLQLVPFDRLPLR